MIIGYTFRCDKSFVILHDFFANSKTDPCSFVLNPSMQSLKNNEYLLQIMWFKSDPIIFHKYTQIIRVIQIEVLSPILFSNSTRTIPLRPNLNFRGITLLMKF